VKGKGKSAGRRKTVKGKGKSAGRRRKTGGYSFKLF
jgi:hypothetical protein